MSFKQFSSYKMQAPVLLSGTDLENALVERQAFKPHATQSRSIGWTSPLGEGEPMVISLNGLQWMQVRIDNKLLPAAVIKDALVERLQEVEAQQGFPPSGKQKRQMRDEITLELLPKAFVQSKWVNVVIDPQASILLLDNTSASIKDMVVDLMRQTFGSLPLTHYQEKRLDTAGVLKSWMHNENLPPEIALESECTLVHPENMQAKVKVVHHELDSPLIQSHIDSGMLVTQLAMNYDNSLQFVVNDCLDVSRVKLIDIDPIELDEQDPKARMMADFSLKVPQFFALLTAFESWFDLVEAAEPEAANAE